MFATDDWIIEHARVHRSTVARWRARRAFPPALERLCELELQGRLELIHAAWTGFIIDARTGELVTPGGERYRAGEILAMPIRYQLVREYERLDSHRSDLRQGWGLRGLIRAAFHYARSVFRGSL